MTTTVRTDLHRGLSVVAGLGLAVTLALLPGTAPASGAPQTADVRTEVSRADSSIAHAVRRVRAEEYAAASRALDEAAGHVRRANLRAVALVGAPPSDPESDDPPGPPAVQAALRLDNRVSLQLVPVFDGMNRSRVLEALRAVVRTAQLRRDAVLDRVLALPVEGDGADYGDGLADTLPSYSREVAAYTLGLDTYRLTTDARSALAIGLDRARAAEARMTAAYGGGERPAR